jgi:hypothetical protein
MQDGQIVTELELLASDGRPRRLSLTRTDKYFDLLPLPHYDARNPDWDIFDPQTHDHATFRELRYLTQDRSPWIVYAKSYWFTVEPGMGGPPGEQIATVLTHRREDGRDEHDDSGIIFLDWTGHPWQARTLSLRDWPRSPPFLLKRL